jgi:hypothetical protein
MRVLLAFALLMGAACATTTKIVSEPAGAVVTDNTTKKELGKTPMTYESKMWIWESDHLTVKAPGKKPKVVEVKRSEVDWVGMIGGICLTPCCGAGIPIILADGMKFPETTTVKLENGGDAPPTSLNDGIVPADVVCMKY